MGLYAKVTYGGLQLYSVHVYTGYITLGKDASVQI